MEQLHIVTPRLVIKDIELINAYDMLEYRVVESVQEFQSFHPKNIDDIKQFIAENTNVFNTENSWYQIGVFLDGKLIGDIGIHFLGPENLQCEIGYTISPNYQKRGYGKESVSYVLNYLFNNLKKHRVFASLDPKNISSISLLERIGFRKEGLHIKSILNNGVWEDDLIYAILDEEWEMGRYSPNALPES